MSIELRAVTSGLILAFLLALGVSDVATADKLTVVDTPPPMMCCDEGRLVRDASGKLTRIVGRDCRAVPYSAEGFNRCAAGPFPNPNDDIVFPCLPTEQLVCNKNPSDPSKMLCICEQN